MIKGFADIVIADITAWQINHYFAEIVPRTVYLLYGMIDCMYKGWVSGWVGGLKGGGVKC